MIDLDLQAGVDALRFKREGGKRWVFDPVRRKWLVLQPEELVRQLVIRYLVSEKGYRASHLQVERRLEGHFAERRFDVLVLDPELKPFLLLECKAPQIPLSDEVFRQVASYNLPLQVPFLLVTNGRQTYCCAMDYERQSWSFLTQVPDYPRPGAGS